MREIKFEMLIRALKDTKHGGHKKGTEIKMTNDIFCRNSGIAFFEIGLDWEIVWRRQFTGLHDKNGKEIYEGDLLELANGETISVSFNWGKFLGIRKNGTTSLTSFYWIYAKIIGNIYETHELLNANPISQ